jgi:hypothetical protein
MQRILLAPMKPIEKKLLKLFGRLGAPERDMLLGFAEFLVARTQDSVQEQPAVPQPLDIPRPEQESVVAAIKRLSSTYHMLDDTSLLNEASILMSQHVMQGREAEHVINDLQALFDRFYQDLLAELDDVLENDRK